MKSIKVIAIFMFSPCFVSENSPIECQVPNVAAFARAWNAFRHSRGLQDDRPSGDGGYAKQPDAALLGNDTACVIVSEFARFSRRSRFSVVQRTKAEPFPTARVFRW